MKMRNYSIYVLVLLFFLTDIFVACNKDSTNVVSPTDITVVDSSINSNVDVVPFFTLSKGDTIEKEIFREKPEFDENIQVMFSSEEHNRMLPKAIGQSSGGGFIYDIKAHISSSNDAPSTFSSGGKTYYKIPVDINEGAGGKWIYLYYARLSYPDYPLVEIIAMNLYWYGYFRVSFSTNIYDILGDIAVSIISMIKKENLVIPDWIKLGTTTIGLWADLNDGAGGPYIYLQGKRSFSLNSGISDIMVISSTSSMSSYSGWHLVDVDLNKGVGGKYIYLCYK